MSETTFYRIDHRKFEVGDVVGFLSDHINTLDGDQLKAENLLREFSPEALRQARSKSVYLFEHAEWAKKYYVYRPQPYLYEVTYSTADFVHAADMELFNDIAAKADDRANAQSISKRYWDGEKRGSDRVEHLVKEAVVSAIILTPADRQRVFKDLYQTPTSTDDNFYKIPGLPE